MNLRPPLRGREGPPPSPAFTAGTGSWSRFEAIAATAGAAAIVLFALWSRFDGLLAQTPFHDEWHAVVAVATETPWQSAAKFAQADRSIPVVLWLHLLASTVGLTAASLWLPFAIAGLLGVVGLPFLLRRELGQGGALVFAALLAASPLLIFYSRFVRPYGVCALGAVVAVVVLSVYLQRPRASLGLLFVALATAVSWALPVFVPFLAGALVLELALSLRPPRRNLTALLVLAAAVTCALTLLFLPALLADVQSLRQKGLAGQPKLASLFAGVQLLLGVGASGWILVPLVLAGLGGVHLRRVAPRCSRCLAAGCVGQLAVVLAVRPAELERAFVFARYELPVGIVWLAAVAAGVGWLATRSKLATLIALAGLVGWVGTAPLDLSRPGADNFASMRIYHRLFFSRAELAGWFSALPASYRTALARDAGGRGGIIEVPYNGLLRVPYPYYQALHGREVFLGKAESLCIDEGNRELPPNDASGRRGIDGIRGLRLRRFVDLADPVDMGRTGARFVIFHRDVESEVPWVRPETRRRNRFDFERCVAAFSSSTGLTPVIADGLAVFELADP